MLSNRVAVSALSAMNFLIRVLREVKKGEEFRNGSASAQPDATFRPSLAVLTGLFCM
jgi:hypothetical protein